MAASSSSRYSPVTTSGILMVAIALSSAPNRFCDASKERGGCSPHAP